VGALQRFEERLEHLVTGAFARVFRSAVQPVEIAAALQREMDNSAQILSRDRRLAPNTFGVELAATDHDQLAPYGGTLTSELLEMLRQHAEEAHYVFAGPVTITFSRSEELATGQIRVRSAALAQVTPAPGQPRPQSAVRSAPAVLEVNGQLHPLGPPGLVVGRGSDADLRINDPGVSRKHAEFRVFTSGPLIQINLVDLGSTNGTTVNGTPIQQTEINDGDVVLVGSTEILVRNPRVVR
jgi:hypothetical protein